MEKGQGKGTDTLQTDKVFTRKEYIEREAAISVIAKISNESDMPVDWHKGMSVAMSAVCHIPAADVRPVVRCKDCRYAYDIAGWWFCSHGTCVDCIVEEDFFCADGARMMDGDGDV